MPTSKEGWARHFNPKKINIVVRILILSDILIIGGFGLLNPIFAVFVTDSIEGGTVEIVGLAMGVYSVTKGIFQIPFAAIIDKIKGEKDDFWAMVVGSTLFSLVPLFYLAVSRPWQLYLVQFVYGAVAALTFPSWSAIFTRHIDHDYEGLEWGFYQTMTDFSGAAMAALGGFIAYQFGFHYVFFIVSAFSLLGSFFLLGIREHMRAGRVILRGARSRARGRNIR